MVIPVVLAAALTGCNDQPRLPLIGLQAPDFTVQDTDHKVRLNDLKGKIVILNFWTSWCEPCIVEMPSLKQLQKQMVSRVTVLAVSTDEDAAAYHRFLQQYNIDFLTVNDRNKLSSDLYHTTGQPETFIIDPSGVVRRKFIGPVDWTSPQIVDYLQKL